MKITMDTTFQEIRDAFANINADDIEHDEFALQMKEARNNTKNNGKILNQEFDFFIWFEDSPIDASNAMPQGFPLFEFGKKVIL